VIVVGGEVIGARGDRGDVPEVDDRRPSGGGPGSGAADDDPGSDVWRVRVGSAGTVKLELGGAAASLVEGVAKVDA
jgi:hypothetical protein